MISNWDFSLVLAISELLVDPQQPSSLLDIKLHAFQMIDLAIRTIRGGGTLKNEPISLYKSRYDSSTYSIVNHIMRRYQVDVPLRTQGWINDKLISVTIENGKCEHLRYSVPKVRSALKKSLIVCTS